MTRVSDILAATTITICAAVIAYKFLLVGRLNINWDEFYYLSFVHAYQRGDFNVLLQGSFVHLFGWITERGNEADQVVMGRWVMVTLLGATAILVWQLGRRWLQGFAASVPPFVYLTSVPVLLHGGSFRSDSMIVFLLMSALVAVSSPAPRDLQRAALAGALFGAAIAVSVKVVLFAPILAILLFWRRRQAGPDAMVIDSLSIRAACWAVFMMLVVAASILALHKLSLPPSGSEPITEFGSRVARKTLLDAPWFPRIDVLQTYLAWQPLGWALMGFGWVLAVGRRRWDVVALGLSLLPVAIYRNAFPYFYVVMLAPASILAGFAIQETTRLITRSARPVLADVLIVVLWAGLLHQGLMHAGRLAQNEQNRQRAIIDAVHEIFPRPVTYVDRCGMISSFPKVNPFLSTWGVESYRARGLPFMPEAMIRHKAAFVLVNSVVLNPAIDVHNGLLPQDLDSIRRLYPAYWGPLRVAGGTAVLSDSRPASLDVPYPEEYRLLAKAPIEVDGRVVLPGDVISVAGTSVSVKLPGNLAVEETVEVVLVLAAARPPPANQLSAGPIFQGL